MPESDPCSSRRSHPPLLGAVWPNHSAIVSRPVGGFLRSILAVRPFTGHPSDPLSACLKPSPPPPAPDRTAYPSRGTVRAAASLLDRIPRLGRVHAPAHCRSPFPSPEKLGRCIRRGQRSDGNSLYVGAHDLVILVSSSRTSAAAGTLERRGAACGPLKRAEPLPQIRSSAAGNSIGPPRNLNCRFDSYSRASRRWHHPTAAWGSAPPGWLGRRARSARRCRRCDRRYERWLASAPGCRRRRPRSRHRPAPGGQPQHLAIPVGMGFVVDAVVGAEQPGARAQVGGALVVDVSRVGSLARYWTTPTEFAVHDPWLPFGL
jgi:hypothetical protein